MKAAALCGNRSCPIMWYCLEFLSNLNKVFRVHFPFTIFIFGNRSIRLIKFIREPFTCISLLSSDFNKPLGDFHYCTLSFSLALRARGIPGLFGVRERHFRCVLPDVLTALVMVFRARGRHVDHWADGAARSSFPFSSSICAVIASTCCCMVSADAAAVSASR